MKQSPSSGGRGRGGNQSSAKRRPSGKSTPPDKGRKPAGRGKKPTSTPPSSNGPIRLNRYLALSGVCTRREADVLIETGAVKVNGEVVTTMGFKVNASDSVNVGGTTIKPETKRYILLNKPKGFSATSEDPRGRRTVMDLIRNKYREGVFPVGKMEREATGLLLLTNDVTVAERLGHPRHSVRQIYQISLGERVNSTHIDKLLEGFVLDEGFVKATEVSVLDEDRRQLGLELHSNRSRIARRVFEHFGYRVLNVDRVVLGHLTKKDLPRGHFRELTESELNLLWMSL